MDQAYLDRRRFIVAAVTFSSFAHGLRSSRAWAQAGAFDPDARAALADMARRLYPHAAIPDTVYAEVLDDALAATAGDPSFAAILTEAETALNAQQSGAFVDLNEQAQIEAMRRVEQMPFFGAVQAAVRVRLYNHPAVWSLLGYEGPSFQQGGYLNRGAGEIDWLPERD